MNFEKWWEERGCRKECLTHEQRAKQAWNASIDEQWDDMMKFAVGVMEKVYDIN